MNRLISNPFVQQKPNLSSPFVSQGVDKTPKLLPSLSNFQASVHLQQTDAKQLNKVASAGFLYPCGLPSLRFFLPEGTSSLTISPAFASVCLVTRNVFSDLFGCLENAGR